MIYKRFFLLACCCLSLQLASAQTAGDSTPAQRFAFVEQMPEYQGGTNALYRFIATQTRYPDSARKNGVEGRVMLKFIVNEDGSISDITIARSTGDSSLDQEAIRVVKLMPHWKPGKQNGTAVKVYYMLPFTFSLQNTAVPTPDKTH